MKSICIKVVNPNSIEYLQKKLTELNMDELYFSCKKFKIYDNIILHFKGNDIESFLDKISTLLSHFVIDLYEQDIIYFLTKCEYFYMDSYEHKKISENTFDDLYNPNECVYFPNIRFKLLYDNFYKYLQSNHSIVLKGFITFRTKNYLETLLEQIDKSVNKYVIEKEYKEFISLLKIYINSEPSSIKSVYLIYNKFQATLLDEHKNIINTEINVLNAKYLSDISFSNNDCVLNTLLNLVPQKIYVHLIDNSADEFINTLKLIFEDRIILCN